MTPPLTHFERRLLDLRARGKSIGEMATVLAVRPEAVWRAFIKLGQGAVR